MPSFDEAFAVSKTSSHIKYEDKIVYRIFKIKIKPISEISIYVEKVNSEWAQGFKIETIGKMICGDSVAYNKSFVFWEKTAPKVIHVSLESRNGELKVWNVWNNGSGCTEAWLNGAGMVIEEISNGYRFKCNDGHPDDNFDDLVFRIVIDKGDSDF
jgi:hypothetical protein